MAYDDSRLSDYVDVPQRIAEFRSKYPNGSLQPADRASPYRVERIGDKTFVVVVAAAYRTPDDQRPGIGMAYEQFPGRTPYTKDSELQNAETAAWGRAIVAVLASESKSVASADEVRNRQADNAAPSTSTRICEECHLPIEGQVKPLGNRRYAHKVCPKGVAVESDGTAPTTPATTPHDERPFE